MAEEAMRAMNARIVALEQVNLESRLRAMGERVQTVQDEHRQAHAEIALVKGQVEKLAGLDQEHIQLNNVIQEMKAKIEELDASITGRGRFAGARGGEHDDDGEGPTAKERRSRLDKMSEAKSNITPFESMSKSSQSFKELLEDLREHIENYDSQLATAVHKLASISEGVKGEQLEGELGITVGAGQALRRLLLQYTIGEAKMYIRARPDMRGLDLWRSLSGKYDAMTTKRAMADCGRLTRTTAAKDWAELSKMITAYSEEVMLFEARMPIEEHLPDRFKRQAVWDMVPEKEQDLHQHIKENTKTWAELVDKLETLLVDKLQQATKRTNLGAVTEQGKCNTFQVGEEIEYFNTETGDTEVMRFGVSGKWSTAGVKSKKTDNYSNRAPPQRNGGDSNPARGKECSRCGRMNHFAKDCWSTRDKTGKALPAKNVPAKNIEDEIPAMGISICAIEEECQGCDPWQMQSDPWGGRPLGMKSGPVGMDQCLHCEEAGVYRRRKQGELTEESTEAGADIEEPGKPAEDEVEQTSDHVSKFGAKTKSLKKKKAKKRKSNKGGTSKDTDKVIDEMSDLNNIQQNSEDDEVEQHVTYFMEEPPEPSDKTTGWHRKVGSTISRAWWAVTAAWQCREAEEELVIKEIPICSWGDDTLPKTAGSDRAGSLVWLTMDTGAGKSCAPRGLASGYNVQPSAGSRAGQNFVGPGGERYPNEGEVKLPFITEHGRPACGAFQVAEGLTKPLAAISDSCDKGNLSVFDNDGSFLINRESEEGKAIRELVNKARDKVQMYRKNGVYVMPVWLQSPEEVAKSAPFQRQGKI